jgi:hemoglobin/transferrin/lactoferrin receptor protein
MRNLFFTIILFISGITLAQKVKVLDQQTGKIIKNTSIFNDKETINITTDLDGFADISEFKDTEIVVFSHLSYAVLRVKKAVIKSRNYIIYLTKESEQLDEVVISLFKKEEKTARIAEQIAVLNARDIQKISPQTSADLLATIPGIKVQKSQFGGGSPVIRGMESNRVLLVVDGVRMNNAIYRKGHLQSSITVTPNMLEKTEVVFGPSSVLYGSDALGGVIHYYTKTPKLSQENEVESQLFSRFSTVNQEVTTNVSAEVRRKNWASLTSVSYSDFGDLKAGTNRSHGFNDWGRVHFFSENTNGNYSENPTENSNSNIQRNTGYKQTDLLQKFFVPLSKDTDLKVNLQYSTSSDIPRFDRLAELKDGELKFAEWFYGPQKRFLASTQLLLNPSKKWVESGIITAAYQNIQESRIQRKFGSLDRSYREETVAVYSLNGDFSISLTADKRRTFSYGFEFAYNDVNSNAIGKELNIVNGEIAGFSNNFKVQSRYPDGGSNYSSSAVYLDYRQDINSKSTLNSGIRFTNTNLNATWIDQTFIQLAETTIHANHSAVTATVGYVYKPNKNWQINSVVSSGFRSPNIDDIGRVREKAGNVTVPNIHVTPEFAYNAEIGVQKYFNDKKFRFGATIYYTLLDNYIQRDFVYNSDGSMQQVEFDNEFGNAVSNQNKDKAYITGYTANYLGKISNAWRTSGFVTFTKGRTYDTNEPMSSIPPLFGQFEVNYKVDRLELGAALRFNSKKDIADFNITEGIDNHDLTPIVNANATEQTAIYAGSPSWVTVGLNGRFVVSDNFSVLARFDNLLDQHYIEFASGVASPGRNLSLSFMANF